MKNLIKWMIRKITEIELMDVMDLIYKIAPVEKAIDKFCDFLAKLADKTETEIDDIFVEDLRSTLKQICLGKLS